MAIEIVKGEDQAINVTLRDKATGDPIDLTSVQTITAGFVVGSTTVKAEYNGGAGTITVSNATSGKITFTVGSSTTSGLDAVTSAKLQVNYQIGGSLTSVIVPNALSVSNRLF